jgi:hypothetical protein
MAGVERSHRKNWLASLLRTSIVLALSSAGSKTISLLRDVSIVWTLGIGRPSDALQLAFAVAGGVAGVLGSGIGLALIPEVTADNGRVRRLSSIASRCLVLLLMLPPLLVAGSDRWSSSLLAASAIIVVAGLLDALSTLIVLGLQGAGEFRIPAMLLGLNGLVTSGFVSAAYLRGHGTPGTIAVGVALDSTAIASLLVLRLRYVAARTGAPTASIDWRMVLCRWAAGSTSYFLIGTGQVLQRLVAARVPGGATILALAQRVANVLNGLVLQPFHFLIFPQLASAHGRQAAGTATVRFSLALARATMFLVFPVVLIGPSLGHSLVSGSLGVLLQSGAPTLAALALALSFGHLAAVTMRDWLVQAKSNAIVTGFAINTLVNALAWATPAAGPLMAAVTEAAAQAAQAAFCLVRNRFVSSAYLSAGRSIRRHPWLVAEGAMALLAFASALLPVPLPTKIVACSAWAATSLLGGVRPAARMRQIVADLWPTDGQLSVPDGRVS